MDIVQRHKLELIIIIIIIDIPLSSDNTKDTGHMYYN